MIAKICTDVEQSNKFIELGIDVNTADMCYHFIEINKTPLCVRWEKVHDDEKDNSLPAWSLAALLDILAKQDFIIKSLERNNEYQYNIDIPSRHCKIWFPSLLDAAFEMICWLKKNNGL